MGAINFSCLFHHDSMGRIETVTFVIVANTKTMKRALSHFALIALVWATLVSPMQAQNALDFDGTSDRVDCGNDASLQITGSEITLEAWIYPTAWKTSVWQGCIINKEQNTPDNGYMLRAGEGGRLNFNLGDGSWNELTTAAGTLELNTWQHVAGTYDGTKMRIYVDGVAVDSSSVTLSITNANTNLIIGDYTSNNRNFQGVIDEVRIWKVQRTGEQLIDYMENELCTSDPDLVAYYQFDEGVAGDTNTTVMTLPDWSGNGNGRYPFPHLSFSTVRPIGSAANPCPRDWASMMSPSLRVGSYTVPSGDETHATSGVYLDTVGNVNECDSILVIDLTIATISSANLEVMSCGSYTVPSGGESYTSSGIYLDTIPNALGCDSLLTIDLTLSTSTSSSVDVTVCSSYTVPSGRMTYGTSGIYSDTIPNAVDCDSVIAINLTILPTTSASLTMSDCFSYTVPSGDETYTSSGMYMDTIPNSVGCDSILTIDLTIDTVDVAVSQAGSTLTANPGADSYQWLDCNDNYAPIPNETDRVFTASENGNYAVEIVSTVMGCSDTSACVQVTEVGIIDDYWGDQIRVYPNPASARLTIEMPEDMMVFALVLTDLSGQEIVNQTIPPGSTRSQVALEDLVISKGIYVLTLQAEAGTYHTRLTIE